MYCAHLSRKSAVRNTFNVNKSEQRTGKLFVNTECRVYVTDVYEHTHRNHHTMCHLSLIYLTSIYITKDDILCYNYHLL